MILLDTNALIWLLAGHQRAAPLLSGGARLCVSPVSLLELKFLVEVDRVKAPPEGLISIIERDPRLNLDTPSSGLLFKAALDLDWTRDPFDRLLVAHAACRRWRFATGDRSLIDRVPNSIKL